MEKVITLAGWFISFCLVLSISGVEAKNIELSAEVSSVAIAFENTDTLTVRLSWQGEPYLYELDAYPTPTLQKLEAAGSATSISSGRNDDGDEITTRIYTYYLKPIDYGTGVIEPIVITAQNRETGESHTLETGRITVEIDKPIPKPTRTRPQDIIIGILLAVVVLGCGGLIWAVSGPRRREDTEKDTQRPLINELEQIRRETVSEGKQFYSRLYRLLIRYLETEHSLHLAGKTGQEVLEAIAELDDSEEKVKLTSWIEKCQDVKFQPISPTSEQIESTYIAVISFFEQKATQK